MRELKFAYRMSLSFDSPVCDHYFALRCVPGNDENQSIRISEHYVTPADCLNEVLDGFGNRKYVGHAMEPHTEFAYGVEGYARVRGMRMRREALHPMYRYPSAYTQDGPALQAFRRKLFPASGQAGPEGNLEAAVRVMHALYECFQYRSGVTDIHTTAEQALTQGAGVCQDYAHIMIALLRPAGIPARYVNGLMIGEGATHAWIEIYTGEGWYGLDPTNDLRVDDYYIKLAHGRDYGDCVLDKGRFLGNASQEQQIYVIVEEVKDDRDGSGDGAAGGRASAHSEAQDPAGAAV